MTRKDGLALVLTLLFGALLGYIDLNSSEVFLPIACLLLFAFTLGAFQPKAAWRWGLLIGLERTGCLWGCFPDAASPQ